MKKSRKVFQNAVIVSVVVWLLLFVLLPNLIIIGTSFLTRDATTLAQGVFTLNNCSRLLDTLYEQVLLHSLKIWR